MAGTLTMYDVLKKEASYAQNTAMEGFGDSLLNQTYGRISMAFTLGAITAEEFYELNAMTVVFMNTNRDFIAVQNRQFIENARMCALPECAGCDRKGKRERNG